MSLCRHPLAAPSKEVCLPPIALLVGPAAATAARPDCHGFKSSAVAIAFCCSFQSVTKVTTRKKLTTRKLFLYAPADDRLGLSNGLDIVYNPLNAFVLVPFPSGSPPPSCLFCVVNLQVSVILLFQGYDFLFPIRSRCCYYIIPFSSTLLYVL